jgi:hypothetical protein
LKFSGTTFLFVHEIDAQYPHKDVDFEHIVDPKVRFLRRSPPEQQHYNAQKDHTPIVVINHQPQTTSNEPVDGEMGQ